MWFRRISEHQNLMIIYRSIFVSLYIDIVVLGVLHIYKDPNHKVLKGASK